jgi:hypothetical protein
MLVFGLPLFVLLRHYRLFRLWIVCAPGAAVPLALFFDAPFRLTRTASRINTWISHEKQ